MEEKDTEVQKINIGDYKKIDNILDNDRLIKIYGLLPDKETKKEFLETVLGTYEDRVSEKFQDRLQDEFEANDSQIRQEQLRENIKNERSITDILRSRRREPLRQGVTERINSLVTQLQEGNYISKEDAEFLAKHLAGRPSAVGETPSSKREEIRGIIDKYIAARNKEMNNNANALKNKQDLQSQIMSLKEKLRILILHQNDPITVQEANSTMYDEVNKEFESDGDKVIKRREREIENVKKTIAQLEELQSAENSNNPLNSMMHTVEPEFDVEKSNAELEKLMEILDRESAELIKQGVKSPETGLKEDDEVEIDSKDNQSVAQVEGVENSEKITPEEIREVIAIDPRALQIMNEISATKQLVQAGEREDVDAQKE